MYEQVYQKFFYVSGETTSRYLFQQASFAKIIIIGESNYSHENN